MAKTKKSIGRGVNRSLAQGRTLGGAELRRRYLGMASPQTLLETAEMRRAWGTTGDIGESNKVVKNRVAICPSPKSFVSFFTHKLLEYTKLSSMHGLRYIGDNSLHPVERIFWLFSFFTAVGFSTYFITFLFNKYNEMPVIMSLSPMSSSIRDVPFPSLTICNMNNLRKDLAQQVKERYEYERENASTETYLEYKMLYDFCMKEPDEELDKLRNVSSNWDNIKKFMIKMTQPCHELLIHCDWHGNEYPCEDLFNPSLTDEGMCCVFNGLKREDIFKNLKELRDLNASYPNEVYAWTAEKGYPRGMSPETLPRRARGSGMHLGLTIVVDSELDQYFCSSENSKGFKILLTNPMETPKVKSFALSLSPGSESKVVILPRVMKANVEVRQISVPKRMCFFEEEKPLTFYKSYSQKSCILECEANFTLKYCGCVMYYMPKNSKTRICGRDDTNCAKNAQRKMELRSDPTLGNLTNTQDSSEESCDCLPSCFEVSYGFSISESPLSESLDIRSEIFAAKSKEYFLKNMGIMHFYYMETQISGTVRGVLYGFTEFLSSTGGLLGLFLGFSFLSGVEIIYFVTMRMFFYFKSSREKKLKKLEEKEEANATAIASKKSFFVVKTHYPFTE